MKEFVEKLIGRLEEEVKSTREMQTIQCKGNDGYGTPLQAKLSGEICALLKAKNIVNQLAEEYNNGWIACSERLPEEPRFREDTYLIQESDVVAPYSAYWNGKYWTNVLDEEIENVIAWQPLSPYKEGE